MLRYYEVLGVTKDTSQSDIKKAYRIRAMELHPDRNQGKDTTAEFQNLQEAYDVLSNEKLRQQYDADSSIPPNRTTMKRKVTSPLNQLFVRNVVQSQQSLDSRFFMQFMAMYLELTKSRIKAFFVQNVKSKLDLKLQQLLLLLVGGASLDSFGLYKHYLKI